MNNSAQSVTATFKANTITTITNSLSAATVVGQQYAVNFSVTSTAGTPTGTVTISDGTANCSASVASGTCSLTPTSAGAKTITASYAGDTNFTNSTSAGTAHTVNKANTAATITNSLSTATVVGQAYAVNFSITVASPGAGTPSGTVTVSDGTDSCSATLPATSCNLTSTTAGSKTVTAGYAGDANFLTSTSAGTLHTVNKASQTITFTSTVPSSAVYGGTYTVSATGGGSGNPVTFSSLTTTVCSVSNSTVSFVGIGLCTVAANQAGNANYLAAPQSTQTFTISKATAAVSAVANSKTYGTADPVLDDDQHRLPGCRPGCQQDHLQRLPRWGRVRRQQPIPHHSSCLRQRHRPAHQLRRHFQHGQLHHQQGHGLGQRRRQQQGIWHG